MKLLPFAAATGATSRRAACLRSTSTMRRPISTPTLGCVPAGGSRGYTGFSQERLSSRTYRQCFSIWDLKPCSACLRKQESKKMKGKNSVSSSAVFVPYGIISGGRILDSSRLKDWGKYGILCPNFINKTRAICGNFGS